jgi:hypothetical protein
MTAFNDTFYSVTFNASGQPFNGSIPETSAVVTSISTVTITNPFVLNFASASSSAAFSVTASGFRIVPVTSASSNPVFSVAAVATTQTVATVSGVTLNNKLNVIISYIDVFRESIVEDTSTIKPFFSLDGVPLTEHNRTFSSSMEVKKTINKRTNGASGVYFKTGGAKKTFNLNWAFVPGKRTNTVDYNAGRDYIFSKANDPSSHVLSIRNMDSSGLTPYTVTSYNVLITDYNESLKRRDVGGDDYYWDCSFVLREI